MSGKNSARSFRVVLSADFCDQQGKPVFPDLGLSLLDAVPAIAYEFLGEYRPEYAAEQLENCDVLISLKPRVTAQSLQNASELCAIGRCGVGYDNVDLEACTKRHRCLHHSRWRYPSGGRIDCAADAGALSQSHRQRPHGAPGSVDAKYQ